MRLGFKVKIQSRWSCMLITRHLCVLCVEINIWNDFLSHERRPFAGYSLLFVAKCLVPIDLSEKYVTVEGGQ